jgi:hypothetical protein
MEGYDFLIIGSGITGINIGMELTKKGFKTLNIDRSMDLGYPVSGSCFISLSVFNRYFRSYEEHVNGIFSSIIIKDENSEEEISLPAEKKIVSMDREKIVRQMATDLSQIGGKISIASTMNTYNLAENGRLRVNLKREGKDTSAEIGKIILATGNPEESSIRHDKNCKFTRSRSVYSRGKLGKFPVESFRVAINKDMVSIEAIYMGSREVLQINQEQEAVAGAEATFRYSTLRHSCFPPTDPDIIASGNMLGTANLTGTGIGFSMDYNQFLIDRISGDREELLEKYNSMNLKNDFTRMDLVDSILHRIPVYS